ncbi:MAG: carboxypeptidase-like regulatory domain-containing protein [Prevotellaceae bacterium]|jgi:hypothetical protein|nr:carboxypeptidase-like regulatory domain-containing protein [Prevotellaceae bacterium]
MKKKIILLIFNLLLTVFALQAQVSLRTITGTVVDANNGEPIIGVSVMLKGTNTGTVTGFDGKYSIKIPSSEKQILTFSCIGYRQQEISIESGKNIVNVNLEEESLMLSEVVVVGYGIQKKSSMTGSVAGVSATNIQKKSGGGKGTTWKRSGMPENSIRLEVGDGSNDFLPLQAAQMAVQIDGFRVRVLMDCFFFNDKKNNLEGAFKLRLPTSATPYYFAFGETEYLDEEEDDDNQNKKKVKPYKIPYTQYNPEEFDLAPDAIEDMDSRKWDNVKQARIVSKQKAARAYEETVSAKIDPALMEWAGADFFSCRVFPLSENTLHRIVIGYEINMTEALDFREYILTLPKAEKDFKLDISIYASENMKLQISPELESKQVNDRLYVSVENPKKKEYAIHYNTVEPVMLSDDNYFAANYRINLPETKQENLPTDAIFLLDVSLSSQPDKFNVWLKLMEEILTKNTDVIRNFSVLCFNIETFWWEKFYTRNNYYNVTQFLEYANTLALEGATDIGAALSEASSPSWLKPDKNAPKHIFLMSDADFNWGESNMHALKSFIRPGDRIHTYKTGLSATNNAVLDYLSKESNGFSFTVTGEEEAVLTAKSFRYRPWIIEDIKVEGIEDFLISGQPSQLYNGQKLIFAGRNKPTGNIYIRVNNGIETKELRLSAQEPITSGLSARLYGQLALGTLESYGYQTEEATESYSTYFRIPNATMSFLMLESEYDYRRFGIDDDDAEYFVEKNTVESVINELMKKGIIAPLNDGKASFLAWLKQLKEDEELSFAPSESFTNYINNLPDEVFNVKKQPLNYRLRLSEQQTTEEKDALNNENIRYDNMLSLANLRKKRDGSADALKLLSSVIERNPGDFIALRDLALKAIEWGMGSEAYYTMQRIISNRRYEATAYLTAADALAKSGNVEMAIIYYHICMNSDWDSDYGSFKEISALQYYRFLKDVRSKKPEIWSKEVWTVGKKANISEQNISRINTTLKYADELFKDVYEYLDYKDLLYDQADIVLIINWNTNNTDVDLHVIESTGEECYYSNTETKIGGKLTIDVTAGYGPEMYVLRHAIDGQYRVHLVYYLDDDTKTSSKTKVYLDFYRNWGRPDEKMTRKTVILENRKDNEDVLVFDVKNLKVK